MPRPEMNCHHDFRMGRRHCFKSMRDYCCGSRAASRERLLLADCRPSQRAAIGQKRSLAGNDAYTSRGEIHLGNDFVTFSLLLPLFPQPITYSYAPVSIPLICNICELLLHQFHFPSCRKARMCIGSTLSP